ncbi:MAG: secreted hydrolase, partial [Myxococcaceae bacterium]|nr:secreted hydrolase [Myxococcaceae bacterium]
FFGRAFVFAPGPLPIVHAGMFAASGGTTEVRFGLDHQADLEPNYMSPPNEYGIFTSNKTKLPTNTWACLEWEYRGTGELHFFLNGSELTQIEVLATRMPPWTAPTYSKFSIGMILFQSDTATANSFDLWFDEVAFSAMRVGCAN